MNIKNVYPMLTKDGEQITISLEQILVRSPKTLLYFYPKDNTPGCTKEAEDFTRLRADFEKLNIQIVGVSKDNQKSHEKFRISCALGIDLISDSDATLHNELRTIDKKSLYGKFIIGVIRSTFLLDSSGNILKEWRNVKATGHAEKVLHEI